MNEVNCPYCKAEIKIEQCECFDSDERYQIECGICGQLFQVQPEYKIFYRVFKTECLNDKKHNYVVTYKDDSLRIKECAICGDREVIGISRRRVIPLNI